MGQIPEEVKKTLLEMPIGSCVTDPILVTVGKWERDPMMYRALG